MTSDPRLVKSAQPVDAITYEEAAELAYFGAEVTLCLFSRFIDEFWSHLDLLGVTSYIYATSNQI
jgi:hypothetical protein